MPYGLAIPELVSGPKAPSARARRNRIVDVLIVLPPGQTRSRRPSPLRSSSCQAASGQGVEAIVAAYAVCGWNPDAVFCHVNWVGDRQSVPPSAHSWTAA